MFNALIIHRNDNVAAVIEPVKKGSPITCRGEDGSECTLIANEDITVYHKVAIKDIAKGEKIIKYGEHIGEAGCDIEKGCHVHVHNVVSVREAL